MEGQMMNNWKHLLPKLKCPLCGNDLKELRMRGEGFSKITLAWICDCEEFKRLEILANEK